MQVRSHIFLYFPSFSYALPFIVLVDVSFRRNNGPSTTQIVIILNADNTSFIIQVLYVVDVTTSFPDASVRHIYESYLEQQRLVDHKFIVGLDDAFYLGHESICCQYRKWIKADDDGIIQGGTLHRQSY